MKEKLRLFSLLSTTVLLVVVTVIAVKLSKDEFSTEDTEAATLNVSRPPLLYCGNGRINDREVCDAKVPAKCDKLGINYAVQPPGFASGTNVSTMISNANRYQMGYTLMMTYQTDSWPFVGDIAYDVISGSDKSNWPIIRLCTYDLCKNGAIGAKFQNPNEWVTYLENIASRVKTRLISEGKSTDFTIYALAGPNEPLNEPWLDGLEEYFASKSITPPGPYSDEVVKFIAQKNAEYMNSVIVGVRNSQYSSNIKLLSPAFNTTRPEFESFVGHMKTYNANFSALHGIAGNAYNLNGYTVNGVNRYTISSFVSRMRDAGFTTQPIFITETGAFDDFDNPSWPSNLRLTHAQALENLRIELETLRNDNQIQALLLFNSFGTNPDPLFQYNKFTDAEFQTLVGDLCMSKQNTACTQGCYNFVSDTTVSPTPKPTVNPSVSIRPPRR